MFLNDAQPELSVVEIFYPTSSESYTTEVRDIQMWIDILTFE
jgi:hypothetical protein